MSSQSRRHRFILLLVVLHPRFWIWDLMIRLHLRATYSRHNPMFLLFPISLESPRMLLQGKMCSAYRLVMKRRVLFLMMQIHKCGILLTFRAVKLEK